MSKVTKGETPAVAEPFFTRLILAPVLFVSFLLSLVIIDRKTYSGIFGQRSNDDAYYHSHQRKLAKREIDDAFQLRSKIIAGICAAAGVGLAFFGWSVSKAWHAITPNT